MVVPRNSQMLQSQLDAMAAHANGVFAGNALGPFRFVPTNHLVTAQAGLLTAWICDNGDTSNNGGLCAVSGEQKVYQLTAPNYKAIGNWVHRPSIVWAETTLPSAASHPAGTLLYRMGFGFYTRLNVATWRRWLGAGNELNNIRLAVMGNVNTYKIYQEAGFTFYDLPGRNNPSEQRVSRTGNTLPCAGRTAITFECENDLDPTVTMFDYGIDKFLFVSEGGTTDLLELRFAVRSAQPVKINGYIATGVLSAAGASPTIEFSILPLTMERSGAAVNLMFDNVVFSGLVFQIRLRADPSNLLLRQAQGFGYTDTLTGQHGLKIENNTPVTSRSVVALNGHKDTKEIVLSLFDSAFKTYQGQPLSGGVFIENTNIAATRDSPGFWKLKDRIITTIGDSETVSGRQICAATAPDPVTSDNGEIHATPGVVDVAHRPYYRRDTDDPNRVTLERYPLTAFPRASIAQGSTIGEVIVSRIASGVGAELSVEIGYMFGPANAAAQDLTFRSLQTVVIADDALSADPFYPDWTLFTAHSLAYRCSEEVNVMAQVHAPNPLVDSTLSARPRAHMFNQIWQAVENMRT